MTVVSYFEKLLEEHGDSPRALDWSEQGQAKRFTVLRDFVLQHVSDTRPDNKPSLVDVGCGVGHFYRRWITASVSSYVGLDASEKMIDVARGVQPSSPAAAPREYRVADAFTAELPSADLIVCSGLLNILDARDAKLPNVAATRLITKMFRACKVGVAVNMLSTWAPTRREDRAYYDPRTMLLIVQGLTPKIALRHDYLPNDFTLFLYK
jgi:SAM-dependent methyltransferase